MKKISKRYKKLLDLNKDKKLDSVEKIIDTVKSNANAKFIEPLLKKWINRFGYSQNWL